MNQPLSRLLSLGILLIFLTIGITVYAQSEPLQPDCAVTYELLGGQGFNFGGQGFNFGGQGFNFGGQGFNFGGQGFNFGGQGFNFGGQGFNFGGQDYSDPDLVRTEVINNATDPVWIANLINGLGVPEGANYGATKAGVIIVDIGEPTDITSHMFLVKSVFDDLASTLDMTHIRVETINIATPTINYRVDAIATAIDNKVQSLRADGYLNNVINMSLAFIPCADPVTGFDINNFVDMVEESQQQSSEITDGAVTPIFECVVEASYGKLYARFGYDNDNTVSTRIRLGWHSNVILGAWGYTIPPMIFETGQHTGIIEIPFKHHVTWSIKGPDGITRSATANKHATRCDEPLPSANQSIHPILECVYTASNGHLIARFGYLNNNDRTVYIAKYSKNKFVPHPGYRGQVTYFLPGRRINAFEVAFSGGAPLRWKVRGPDGVMREAIAPAEPIPCTNDSPLLSLGDYLGQIGVADAEIIPTIVGYVNDTTDISPLRNLLQAYLIESANPGSQYNTTAVASSGNYRFWTDILGVVPPDGPFAPARWPEVIAVSASLENPNQIWAFSQHGDIMTHGVSYELDLDGDGVPDNFYVSGTSIAAPAVSLVLAQFGKFADACIYPTIGGSVYPPIRNINPANRLTNFVLESDPLPLNCDVPVNTPPVADDISVTTDEDTSVLITLTGFDAEDDDLVFEIVPETGPTNGSITGAAPNLNYIPNEDYNGSDTFEFSVSDGYETDTGIVTITINPVNDAPVAHNTVIVLDEDTSIVITPQATDVDEDELTFEFTQPENGQVVFDIDYNFLYTPGENFNGEDSFTFTASDGVASSEPATIDIVVNSVNDLPTLDLGAFDTDGDFLDGSVTIEPTYGVLSGEPASPFLFYTPDDEAATDSFEYTLTDGEVTYAVTVTIAVSPNSTANTVPFAEHDSISTPLNTSVTISVLDNDIDSDGDTLSVVSVISPTPAGGEAVVNEDNTVTYTPQDGFVGVDTFSYVITDGTQFAIASISVTTGSE